MAPIHFDWKLLYPNLHPEKSKPQVLDIGMGFGGLTVYLAGILPDKNILGMEIRAKVCEYVRLRIESLRNEFPGLYANASCLRNNCMRYLPNFFEKQSIEKIFICFPDPHFKAKNHRRRICNTFLLTEYAYVLKPGGKLYLVTDVEELHKWHLEKCENHSQFQRIPDEDILRDEPAIMKGMLSETEESKKVDRIGGKKYFAVYEKIEANNSTTAIAVDSKVKLLKLWL